MGFAAEMNLSADLWARLDRSKVGRLYQIKLLALQ
jgi:hypothetical protein